MRKCLLCLPSGRRALSISDEQTLAGGDSGKGQIRTHLTFINPLIGVPLAGQVSAGFPSPAEEELRDVISFDEYLITKTGRVIFA